MKTPDDTQYKRICNLSFVSFCSPSLRTLGISVVFFSHWEKEGTNVQAMCTIHVNHGEDNMNLLLMCLMCLSLSLPPTQIDLQMAISQCISLSLTLLSRELKQNTRQTKSHTHTKIWFRSIPYCWISCSSQSFTFSPLSSRWWCNSKHTKRKPLYYKGNEKKGNKR